MSMDFSGYTNDDLISILQSMGVEEAPTLSRNELEHIMQTFYSSDQPTTSSEDPNPDLMNTQDLQEYLEKNPSFEIPASPKVDIPSDLDNKHEQTLDDFCSISNCDKDYARTLLESVGWNLETALSLFLEGDQAPMQSPTLHNNTLPVPGPPSTNNMPPFNTSSILQNEQFNLSDFINSRTVNLPSYLNDPSTFRRYHDDSDDDYEQVGRRSDEFDEYGVRRPDPVRRARLVNEHFAQEDNYLDRADDPSVEWLFAGPNSLNSVESFDTVRNEAKAQEKWILVNIQSHEEFASHLLNRDTWSNDIIQSIIRSSFILWQRGHTSTDGQRFMGFYKITSETLPFIGIIDPRTGAKIFSWNGGIEPNDLSLALTEFLDAHSFSSNSLPKRSQVVSSPQETKEPASMKPEEPIPAPEPVKEESKPQINFGEVPIEPSDSDSNAIKISIKLSNGKAIARRYNKQDLVRSLFAVAIEIDPESTTKAFDLHSRFPALALSTCLDKTLEEAGLAGSQIFHRWV